MMASDRREASAERRIVLDAAAFMDSGHAAALDGLPVSDLRTIAQRFLSCCYLDLGKAPRLLDGSDLEEVLTELLPRRFGAGDPLGPCAPDVVRAMLAHLGETTMVSRAYELGIALDRCAPTFCAAVAAGTAHRDGLAVSGPGHTVVHRVARTGRNDPCPCGSGKKFKRCCMPLGPSAPS